MEFLADLHIHSRYSRATSKALTPRHLAAWARCKGIRVLGTGDFTHPQWRQELREQLVPDEESGLYKLATAPEDLGLVPGPPEREEDDGPLFMLQAEISSIYKRGGKVRKIHNLVFTPTLEHADRLSQRLAQIGNLHADGRPILGLDSRDLLEIMLECAPGSVMIPAHVWTPWFALFGSKSGFDRLEDCYGDLSEHIFALETGLSSDPAMNRLVSRLDGYALVSNSDAHSGANLGREANLFSGRPGYAGMFAALRATARRADQSGLDCRFLGTLEFYPDEGKYHLDGHRACNVALTPRESLELGDICPVCGKPLTVGVLHRVLELADRDTPPDLAREPEVRPLIPLAEVLSEILGVGPASRKVQERYSALLRALGPELDILCRLPEERLRAHWEPLGEAVARMRRGQVFCQGGYDGHYGTVRVFAPGERAELRGAGKALPGLGRRSPGRAQADALSLPGMARAGDTALNAAAVRAARQAGAREGAARSEYALSPEQTAAMTAGPAPTLVLAGPGAGKTRVLIGRLQWLMAQDADPRRMLAVTFTRRAAGELRERLTAALPPARQGHLPPCDTLHGLAWSAWRAEAKEQAPLLLGEDAAFDLFCAANAGLARREARKLWDALALARETGMAQAQDSPLACALTRYTARKTTGPGPRRVDYADLLDWLLAHARSLSDAERPQHVLVDEVQDLSPLQLDIVRALLPPDGSGFFGIGDPDQAIYGFRGVTGQSEDSLRACWPDLELFHLGQSYRASQDVLNMARSLLHGRSHCGPLTAVHTLGADLRIFSAPDHTAEARWVAQGVGRLLGATAHTLMDRQEHAGLAGSLAPGDVAVLVRLKAQIPPLRAALEQTGVPCAAPAQEEFWQDATCARLLALLAKHCGFAAGTSPEPEPGEEALPWGADLPEPELLSPWLTALPWAGELFTAGSAWRQCRRLWKDCGAWPAFFERLAWLREAELVRGRAEQVQILTLHASKGLEFQAVFLPGLEDGLLPFRPDLLFPAAERPPAPPDPALAAASLDEERRLLYVGLTRAARALFVSRSARRRLYGRELRLAPSPFLDQIRAFCRQSALTAHTREERRQLRLL